MCLRLILLALFAAGTPCLGLAPSARALELTPCRIEGFDEEARCGTLAVAENPEEPAGRRLAIPVVVVPALAERPLGAVVFIAGGPGASSVAQVPVAAAHSRELRAERDLLFVDTRGLGGPDRLVCTELAERGNLQGFYEQFLPPAKVAPCRERLAARYDLTRYTTELAADDLEAVRRALGYGPLDLQGVSYGTRVALVYARRHPASVRTLTLWGLSPPDDLIPLHFARYFEDALAATFAACAGEPACAAAFPDLDADLRAATAQLARAPAEVELVDTSSGAPVAFRVTPSAFAQALRYMLYVPSSAVLAPLAVHEAGRGNFRPIAEAAQTFFQFAAADFADGFYLSVTCSEDIPFLGDEEVAAATRDTLLGDFRARQQRAACAAWTARPVDPAFHQPVRSPAPALLISGERDPVTPAALGERVARGLPNSFHVVVPDAGHDVEGLAGTACLDRIITEFVLRGAATGLDISCLAGIRRPPFVTSLPGADAPTLGAAELARFTGAFISAEGLAATVVLGDDDRLRLVIFGKPPMLLTPRSATGFGIVGLPPTYALEYELDAAGEVVAVRLLDGSGEAGLRLARRR